MLFHTPETCRQWIKCFIVVCSCPFWFCRLSAFRSVTEQTLWQYLLVLYTPEMFEFSIVSSGSTRICVFANLILHVLRRAYINEHHTYMWQTVRLPFTLCMRSVIALHVWVRACLTTTMKCAWLCACLCACVWVCFVCDCGSTVHWWLLYCACIHDCRAYDGYGIICRVYDVRASSTHIHSV